MSCSNAESLHRGSTSQTEDYWSAFVLSIQQRNAAMNQATAGTDVTLCHPEWPTIRADIGRIFLEGSTTYQRALDAVIAHQLGEDERSRTALKTIGTENSNSLRAICKRYDIELPSDKAA